MKVEKIFAILFVSIALLQTGASQDIETWTDHESVNKGGDTIEIDYPGIDKDNVTSIRVNESKNILAEVNNSREKVFVEYDKSLNGDENLTLEYELNGSEWRTKNIKENLTRFKTDFLGFFRDSDRLTRQIYYRELDNVKVKVNVTKTDGNKTSNVEGLLGEDFEVYSQGSQGKFELDGSSSSPYYLRFSGLPKMEPGRDRFRIKLKHGPDIRQFKVQKRVPFQGQVIGYGGNAKDATFEIIDSSINKFQTDETGKFEELLEKRDVNKKIKLYLGDVTTTFGGLELQSDRKEDIRYEYYRGFSPEEIKTDKLLDPLNLVGFSSNYPIEISETKVTMKYNSSGINPENVKFYECRYWDFLGKECREDWEKLEEDEEVDHNKIRNEATLEDLDTKGDGDYGLKSAYMAAVEYERPFLKLEKPLIEETKFNVEDSIDLDGKIKDGKNDKWVEDANVEVILEKDENTSIAKYRGVNESSNTNEDGLFSFTPIEIPDKEGNYTLSFEASKPGFENKSQSWEIQVDKTLNMSLESPNKELVQGETSTAVFDLENTGQTDISNISINETNMDQVYLTITPESINDLESGDTKSITVSSILPSNYCSKKDCSNGLNLEVEGISENGKSISSDSGVEIKHSSSKEEDPTNKSDTKEDDVQSNTSEDPDDGNEENKESNDTDGENSSKNSEKSSQDKIDIPLTDREIKKSAEEISSRIENTETETKIVFVAAILFAIATLKKRNDKSGRDLKINPRINLEIGETGELDREERQMNTVDRTGRVNKPKITSDNNQTTINNNISSIRNNRTLNEEGDKENNTCPECGESFDTSEALSVHLKTQH